MTKRALSSDTRKALVGIKQSLAAAMTASREASGQTQEALAGELQVARSTISRLENSAPEVSLDAYLWTLLEMGLTREDIAVAIAGR